MARRSGRRCRARELGIRRRDEDRVPPRDEQSAIASFLDRETSKIDSLVGEQRRLIELLKEKRQAVISHAVTKGLNPNAPMKPSGIHGSAMSQNIGMFAKCDASFDESNKDGVPSAWVGPAEIAEWEL